MEKSLNKYILIILYTIIQKSAIRRFSIITLTFLTLIEPHVVLQFFTFTRAGLVSNTIDFDHHMEGLSMVGTTFTEQTIDDMFITIPLHIFL